MNSGALKEKIIIEKMTPQVDEIGNHSSSWEVVTNCRAYMNKLHGKEYWEAAAVQSEMTVEFVLRWNHKLKDLNSTEYRIKYKDSYYNIKDVDNIQNADKIIKIKAVKNE